jgi:hypothetical protein
MTLPRKSDNQRERDKKDSSWSELRAERGDDEGRRCHHFTMMGKVANLRL